MHTQKVCTVCGLAKSLSEFYARKRSKDGLASACKMCHNAMTKVSKNRPHVKEHGRVKALEYYHAHKDKCNTRTKEYRQTKAGRIAMRASVKRYQSGDHGRVARRLATQRFDEKHPNKRRAYWTVKNAIRSGRLTRPSDCSCCGASTKTDAHHDDYSKPLEVRWLCRQCHLAAHHGDRYMRL